MDYFLRDKVERLFLDGYDKDQIISAVNEIAKEKEEKEKEVKLTAAREKVAEATAEYVELLTGIEVDVAEFIGDFIRMEELSKEADLVKPKKEVKLSDNAVNEWLKRNGYSF